MKTFTIGKKKIVLKEEWMVGFITTWIVGLLAHAYRFFNFLPIWDSIYNFTGVGSTYTLGRWFFRGSTVHFLFFISVSLLFYSLKCLK